MNAFAPYSFMCATHKFAWSFGDGRHFSTKSFSRQFSAAGDYPITVTVETLWGSVTLSSTVHVINPPPPICGDLNANAAALTFSQSGTNCGPNGGDCVTAQSISFHANPLPPPLFTCANPTLD